MAISQDKQGMTGSPCKASEYHEEKNEFSNHGTPASNEEAEPSNQMSNQMLGSRIIGNGELSPKQNDFVREGSHRSRTGSFSREDSAGTPTSHGSCQGSPFPANESSPQNELVNSPTQESVMKVEGSLEPAQQREINLSTSFLMPGLYIPEQTQQPFRGMLVEDAGSSHDLTNLCPAGDVMFDERVPESSWTNPPCSNGITKDLVPLPAEKMPQFSTRPEVTSVTIKATYKEDIIRFRLSLNSGLFKLKEEVAKRLKLEVGTFDIKYLDDDHEWVLIACDADLQESVEISRSSGSNVVRLLVHDIMPNLGSSCESSGE